MQDGVEEAVAVAGLGVGAVVGLGLGVGVKELGEHDEVSVPERVAEAAERVTVKEDVGEPGPDTDGVLLALGAEGDTDTTGDGVRLWVRLRGERLRVSDTVPLMVRTAEPVWVTVGERLTLAVAVQVWDTVGDVSLIDEDREHVAVRLLGAVSEGVGLAVHVGVWLEVGTSVTEGVGVLVCVWGGERVSERLVDRLTEGVREVACEGLAVADGANDRLRVELGVGVAVGLGLLEGVGVQVVRDGLGVPGLQLGLSDRLELRDEDGVAVCERGRERDCVRDTLEAVRVGLEDELGEGVRERVRVRVCRQEREGLRLRGVTVAEVGDGEGDAECVAVGVGVPEQEAVGEPGLGLRVALGHAEREEVWEGLEEDDTERVGACVSLRDSVLVPEGGVGLAVGEAEGVDVTVEVGLGSKVGDCVADDDGVSVRVGEREAAERVGEKEAVEVRGSDTETDLLPLGRVGDAERTADGVAVKVRLGPERLGVRDAVWLRVSAAEPVRVGEVDRVTVPVGLRLRAERVGDVWLWDADAVDVPEALSPALRERVEVTVCERLWLYDRKWVAECVSVRECVGMAERVSVRLPERRREAVAVAVWEREGVADGAAEALHVSVQVGVEVWLRLQGEGVGVGVEERVPDAGDEVGLELGVGDRVWDGEGVGVHERGEDRESVCVMVDADGLELRDTDCRGLSVGVRVVVWGRDVDALEVREVVRVGVWDWEGDEDGVCEWAVDAVPERVAERGVWLGLGLYGTDSERVRDDVTEDDSERVGAWVQVCESVGVRDAAVQLPTVLAVRLGVRVGLAVTDVARAVALVRVPVREGLGVRVPVGLGLGGERVGEGL